MALPCWEWEMRVLCKSCLRMMVEEYTFLVSPSSYPSSFFTKEFFLGKICLASLWRREERTVLISFLSFVRVLLKEDAFDSKLDSTEEGRLLSSIFASLIEFIKRFIWLIYLSFFSSFLSSSSLFSLLSFLVLFYFGNVWLFEGKYNKKKKTIQWKRT